MPTAVEILAEFDGDPGRYKDIPEGDGYNKTKRLFNKLLEPGSVTNPDPAAQIKEPVSFSEFFGAGGADDGLMREADQTGLGAEMTWRLWELMYSQHLDSGNNTKIQVRALTRMGKKIGALISDARINAIVDRCDQTYADPEHPGTVIAPSRFEILWGFPNATTAEHDQVNSALGRPAGTWN